MLRNTVIDDDVISIVSASARSGWKSHSWERARLTTAKHLWRESGVNFTNILPQLLRTKIPKAQKDTQVNNFLRFRDLCGVKAAHKHVDEIDPSCRRWCSINRDGRWKTKTRQDKQQQPQQQQQQQPHLNIDKHGRWRAQSVALTELNIINRECRRYLCNEDGNQQLFYCIRPAI